MLFCFVVWVFFYSFDFASFKHVWIFVQNSEYGSNAMMLFQTLIKGVFDREKKKKRMKDDK